jgi:hypothetical protein
MGRTALSWFKCDDCFHSHPKILQAGNEAIGLWARCGAYCSQHLTDGYIPDQIVLIYGSAALAQVLVTARLWVRVAGGYQMHDYLSYNRSRVEVMTERAESAERQRESRTRRRADRRKQEEVNNGHSVSHGVTNTEVSQCESRVSHSVPTRPISTKELSIKPRAQGKSSADADGDFDEFWSSYPRKVQKQDARRAWDQQRKKKVLPGRMIAGAKAYAAECKKRNTDQQFVKHPASWLRAGGFDDYQPEPVVEPKERLRDLWRAADAQAVARILRIPFADCGQPPSDTTPRDQWTTDTRRKWIEDRYADALKALESESKPTETNGHRLTPPHPVKALSVAIGGD